MSEPIQVSLVSGDGLQTFVLRPERGASTDAIYMQSFDRGYPSARDVVEDAPGCSGTLDFTAMHGAATASIALKLVDRPGESRYQLLNRLRAAVSATRYPARALLKVLFPGDETWWRAAVRGSCSAVTGRTTLGFLPASLDLVLAAGAWESDEQFYRELRGGSSEGGVTFPEAFDFQFSGDGSDEDPIIVLGGAEDVAPIYRLYGEASSPDIRNVGTGEHLKFAGLTIPAGSYLDIDVARRSAWLNGDRGQNLARYIDPALSSWWLLQSGANELRLEGDSLGVNHKLEIYWRESIL